MYIFHFFSDLAEKRSAWQLLFFSSLGLFLSALYFQHINDLQPCVKCIYQRTAIIGICLAAFVPMWSNNIMTRLIGFIGWGVSSVQGLLSAYEHVDIQTAANPFFATCELVPNFPKWAPLHDWLPAIFGATGECGDINWQFFGFSMPEWMLVIFATYTAALAMVVVSRLVTLKFV